MLAEVLHAGFHKGAVRLCVPDVVDQLKLETSWSTDIRLGLIRPPLHLPCLALSVQFQGLSSSCPVALFTGRDMSPRASWWAGWVASRCNVVPGAIVVPCQLCQLWYRVPQGTTVATSPLLLSGRL